MPHNTTLCGEPARPLCALAALRRHAPPFYGLFKLRSLVPAARARRSGTCTGSPIGGSYRSGRSDRNKCRSFCAVIPCNSAVSA